MAARRKRITLVQAATSTDLVTLDIVKDELNITNNKSDAKLKRYIAEASQAAQNFINCILAVETLLDEFWPTRDPYPAVIPGGEDPLQLSKYPVVSVASVTENGDLLTVDSDYLVDIAKGQLIRLDSNGYPKKWPAYPIAVQYAAGYAPIPADVAGKIVRMVTGRYYSAGRDPSMMSENIPGVREYRVWVPTGADAGNLPPDVMDVLNNYRPPVIA